MLTLRRIWSFLWEAKRHSGLILLIIASTFLLNRSDVPLFDWSQRVRAFTRQIEFDFVSWTFDALLVKGEQMGLGAADYMTEADQTQIMLDYLDLIHQIRMAEGQLGDLYADPEISDPDVASEELRRQLDELYQQRRGLAPLAESILQNQLSVVVGELGLTLGGQPIPPVLYHVTPLPLALIVSPRDVIRQDADISLLPDLTLDQRVALEDQVAQALDVSTLVVNVGGVGLYPTMVTETTNINWLAEVVSHEWVHNFLTLRPLGFSYLSSPELRIINETTANIADQEIGPRIIERFYPQFVPPPPAPAREPAEDSPPPDPPPFDFRAEMHETRVTVDEMLADGQIEAAEAYMEVRRQFFWENGYRIRKLNQAYFAFYGAYADQPGGAAGAVEDPIGDAVRKLRAQSPSLAAFLNRISWMWRLDQLQDAVGGS